MSVFCAVVTHNRRELLVECVEAVARQTRPPDRVLVVDNASTDGTLERLRAGGLAERLPLAYVRIERNGGGAEGFHYAVRAGVDSGADWIWLMDDDCAPEPDALERLLDSTEASAADTALVAPLVTMPGGAMLPLNRGWLRKRWFLTPLVGLTPADAERDAIEVDHVSLVGPLVRRAAAAATEPPRREMFIWWDDLEWVGRLRRHGRVWLVPRARMVHKETRPMPSTSFGARLRDYRRTAPGWKQAYGLRNMIYCGRREGFLTGPRAAALAAVPIARALLAGRLRLAWRLAAYARDGWHGRFRNVAPADWDRAGEVDPLSYETDVAGEVTPLSPARASR
jgi:rhamnopyranosyl-N-acetylglucosaminyl-diphospho-decaprenol beta-1,3/1,4-galactofuranosyltransferase